MSDYINSNSPEWFDERVEAFIDGLLPSTELRQFEEQLSRDRLLRRQVEEAKAIVGVLRSEAHATCPTRITENVIDYARRTGAVAPCDGPADAIDGSRNQSYQSSSRLYLVPLFKGRHARYAAVLAAACITLLVWLNPWKSPDSVAIDEGAESYTPQEVEQALREAKFAFAVVSDATREAGRAIRTDAVRPVNNALDHVLSNRAVGPRQDRTVDRTVDRAEQIAPRRDHNNN